MLHPLACSRAWPAASNCLKLIPIAHTYDPLMAPAKRMKFKNVVIQSLAAIDPPIRVTSREIEQRLQPTLTRLGIRNDLLEEVSGIGARRFWERGTQPSDAATLAAEKVLDDSGIDRSRVGVIINTSVCRDYLEPSTACIVHGNLGLSESCLNFDVGNACLAFLNGMDIAARMIERAEIEYALIVDGESSRPITEATIERLLGEDVGADQFRAEFASLTLGSGAAAMLMARRELAPEGHPYLGSVSRAATEFNKLCHGQMDRMVTDTRILLSEGLKLAVKTFHAAKIALGWVANEMDQYVIHQVSKVHTESLVNLLGLDPEKVHAIYPEMGNIGPASVPIVLARAVELGKIRRGDRVALLGIGSGLNCSMAEIVW
jgi:3-oxoacyl-[acyl-carrier-protein] synthase III